LVQCTFYCSLCLILVTLLTCYTKGMGAQILKAVLSQGVLFMSKEQFEQYALAIMVMYYRLSSTL
jgi:hypothetical protein